VLIVPESMAGEFSSALRVVDVATGFRLGDAITMKGGHFLVGDDIKGTMPELVTSECIAPMLAKHDLATSDVRDWAIHQGGLPVLMKFKDEAILGLSDDQLTDSAASFAEFGNLSSASCFFTLRQQFERPAKEDSRGMIVAFGAGYYFGCVLYETRDGAHDDVRFSSNVENASAPRARMDLSERSAPSLVGPLSPGHRASA